ncbi:efflux RND transporter periplasmic adaptor subunit [Roseovarius pelagicus]|uniref:Efflux RND transporter periplasmic adaptor subunit n=1 Tax=Roseovarius pelagicus TaxID=2980108 RepID=A0ABY6DG71_9RHOB|nr:efflux RND transporter periplasmic adaptor subunit [Roseovarius pelagicus]UXX82790.1 efflux RND transporter periplasmic adaptor subunit [Roseovarius pelagicus]
MPENTKRAARDVQIKGNRTYFPLILAAALVVGPHPAWAENATATPQKAVTIASVTVASVVEAKMIGRVPVSGTLVPREEVLVFPEVNGSPIDTLQADVGDLVKAGDVLATLNARTLTAELARSKAEFARAKSSVGQAKSQIVSAKATATRTTAALDRAKRLMEAGTTTQTVLDQALADSQTADAAVASATDGLAVAEAQLQQAQAQLDIAELNLERTTLRAPVDGLISARNGQIGAIAASGGEPIFRMIENGIVEVEAEVIETALGQITKGDAVNLSVAGVGDVSGVVRRISPTVDPVNRLGTIRIETDTQNDLRSGVFVSGWVITDQRTSPAVPTSAVLTDSAGTFVLVVADGVLEKRSVVAGLIWNDLREIVKGLTKGEVVVAKAGSFFGDGDKINPIFPKTTTAEADSE